MINSGRFRFMFTVQTLLLLLDILINTFSITYKKHHSILLIFFIVQDICLLLALALLLVSFFSTYVFQAGLVELLYDRFKVTICICILYFVLTTAVYVWILCTESRNLDNFWSFPFIITFIIQRLVSPFYYYFYKRAAMKICDPRFYEDAVTWDQNQSSK